MSGVKGTPQQGLFGATLGFFIGFGAVALFGPTAAKFKEAMGLSPMMVGWLVAMPSLSGSLLRIPFAAWVDTTGGRKPFLVLLSVSILGMTGLCLLVQLFYAATMSQAFYVPVLGLALLCGCGIATFSVGIGQVSYWFPQEKQGGALGIFAGAGNLAPGVFSFLLPLALASWGLSGSYWAWLAFLIAGTLLYFKAGRNAWYFQLRDAGLDPKAAREKAESFGQKIFPAGTALKSLSISSKIWKTWALVAIYFGTFGGFIALTAWFPVYWKGFFGVSMVQAGMLTATYSILASLFRMMGGKISDRFGGERTLLVSLTAMLAGSFVLMAVSEGRSAFLGEVILALGMGTANAAIFKLVPQEVPQAVGGAAGWVGGLGAFGGFAIPPLLAGFIQKYGTPGYSRGFIIFVLLALLSILIALLLKKSRAPEKSAVLSPISAS